MSVAIIADITLKSVIMTIILTGIISMIIITLNTLISSTGYMGLILFSLDKTQPNHVGAVPLGLT